MASIEPPRKKSKVLHTPSFAQKPAFKLPPSSALRTPGTRVQNDYKFTFGKENVHSNVSAFTTPLKTPTLPFPIHTTPLRQSSVTNGASPVASTKKTTKPFAISAEQALANPFINSTPKATPTPKTVLKPPTFQPSTPTPKPSTFVHLPPPSTSRNLFQNHIGDTPSNLKTLTHPPAFTDTHTDCIYDAPGLTKSENALHRELNRGLEISPKKRDTQQGWGSGKRKFVRNGLAERVTNYIHSADTGFMFWRKEIQREPPVMQSAHQGGRGLVTTLRALSKNPGQFPSSAGSTTKNVAVEPTAIALASGSSLAPTPSKAFRLPVADTCVRIEEIVGLVPSLGHSTRYASSADRLETGVMHSVLTRCTFISADVRSAATEDEHGTITQVFVAFRCLPFKSSYTTLLLPPLPPLELPSTQAPDPEANADANPPAEHPPSTHSTHTAQDDQQPLLPAEPPPKTPRPDKTKPRLSSSEMLEVGREVVIWKPFAEISGDSPQPTAKLSGLSGASTCRNGSTSEDVAGQDGASGSQPEVIKERTIFCTRFLVVR